jgi:hypothetical protein
MVSRLQIAGFLRGAKIMVKHLAAVVGALSVLLLFSAPAHAQTALGALGQKHSLGGPTVSPYLNLLTVDNFGIAAGYQTLVKPFVDGRKATNANSADIARLQNQVSRGGSRGGGGGGGGYFMNYSHYYSMGQGGGGARR